MKSSGKINWPLILVALTLCTVLGSGCILSNNTPVISSVRSQMGRVTPSGSSEVECIASDADGDSLTYTWSATAGGFSGTGQVVTWVAPDAPGTYTITVSVMDGRGGEATSRLTIDVVVNHPPVIESLTAGSSVVSQAMSTNIECVASDPDGDKLSYQWATTRGNISGQGPVITWTAPSSCADYTVTVSVIDGRGGEATKELTITVRKPG
ncbi:Ig-like domain-containing protein [Chloroflexota bacterium]